MNAPTPDVEWDLLHVLVYFLGILVILVGALMAIAANYYKIHMGFPIAFLALGAVMVLIVVIFT